MSEPRYISPMLDGFSLGESISDHHGVECYPAMHDDSDKRYIVKKISLPASQVQVEALLLTGVFRDADAVSGYYEDLAHGVCAEIKTLNSLAEQRGFVPALDSQIVPMEDGVGFEVHILSRYRMTLERFTRRSPMTHLGAVNLGIDLCAAMAVCREAGWLYVDLKPENIYLFGDQEYRIGDLGFVALDSLQYASLPDRYRSVYTAPEVADAYARLNATMDTYALGLVLYQIYNNGALPFEGAEGRALWLDRLAAGEAMEAPCCADEEMAGIIRKACALDPADRWQTPAEMGHALISYMQRNGAEDIPISLPAEPEEAEEPAAEDSAAVSVEDSVEQSESDNAENADVAEEISDESIEDSADMEEVIVAEDTPAAEDAPAEVVVEESADEEPEDVPSLEENDENTALESGVTEEATAADADADISADDSPAEPEGDGADADWIDLMDAFLAEEEDGAQPLTAEGEPTLRELLSSTEDLPADVADLPEEALSAETADILNVAQELIDHEAPAPVVIPDPIDVPIPDPIAVELPQEEADEQTVTAEAEPAEESAEETVPAELPAEPKAASGLWKKILGTVAALAAAVGLAFGAWYYYQNIYMQTIDSMEYDGTATSVTVTVSTSMDQSKLNVICKDTYGNAVNGTLENGVVTFSDLVPGSQYMISLEPQGFHKLTGTTSVTYSTPAETKLLQLSAVTGQESGSAIVSFGVEGRDCENWTLICTAEGEEAREISFTGHTVSINELTVGSTYTFFVTSPEDLILVGENVITHTASDLVQASDLTLAEYADGVMTITWNAPEGADRWMVRCSDGAGYDQLLEVTGTTVSFEGITEGSTYTVEVTAANQTLGVRAEITAEASAISGFTASLNGSTVELSWNATGDIPCTIECMADGNVLQVITPEDNTASFGPVAPGTVYTFTVKPANMSADIPGGTATVETAAAGTFSANKLDSESIIVKMYDVPTKSNWNYGTLQRAKTKDTFKPGGSLALLYTVTRPYSSDSTDFETIFVIRDSEGNLVSTSARTRSWDDMWDNGYCTEQVSNMPAEKGDYTLSIYIADGLLAQLPFTIN